MSENKEDYEVFIHSKIDDTEIVTSSSEISKEWLLNSIASYDASNQKEEVNGVVQEIGNNK